MIGNTSLKLFNCDFEFISVVRVLLLSFVCVGLLGLTFPKAFGATSSVWEQLTEILDQTIGRIGPNMHTLYFQFEVLHENDFLGSGTVAFQRDGPAWLELCSRNGLCKFLHTATTTTCLLQLKQNRTFFTSEASGSVPFPVIRIDSDPEVGYRLNLVMNLSLQSASHSMDIDVASGVVSFLVDRIKTQLSDVCVRQGKTMMFKAKDKRAPALYIEPTKSGISSAEAIFVLDDGKVLRLRFRNFFVDQPLPALPKNWMPVVPISEAYTSSITGVPAFIEGFYMLLSDLIPR